MGRADPIDGMRKTDTHFRGAGPAWYSNLAPGGDNGITYTMPFIYRPIYRCPSARPAAVASTSNRGQPASIGSAWSDRYIPAANLR